MFKKTYLFLTLFSLTTAIGTDEYTVNGNSINALLPKIYTKKYTLHSAPTHIQDVAVIHVTGKETTITWETLTFPYNDLIPDSTLQTHPVSAHNFRNENGFLGTDAENMSLYFDRGHFDHTSVAFREKLNIFPLSPTTSAFKSITLEKIAGVKRPMLHGIIDWSQQEFRPLPTAVSATGDFPFDGFSVSGCTVYFNYDFAIKP